MNRKPEIGEYIEVTFDYPRKSQYDYIGYVTRYRLSDDTITVHIVQGDPEKVGKTKHLDWKSNAVNTPASDPTEEDLKTVIDVALFLGQREMFQEAWNDLQQLKERAEETTE